MMLCRHRALHRPFVKRGRVFLTTESTETTTTYPAYRPAMDIPPAKKKQKGQYQRRQVAKLVSVSSVVQFIPPLHRAEGSFQWKTSRARKPCRRSVISPPPPPASPSDSPQS